MDPTGDLTDLGQAPLVLIAGAGLSLWHPSSLPTWDEFTRALLDEAKARGLSELDGHSDAARALATLTIGDVGSKALSNMLVEMLVGTTYFDVVAALDSNQTNEAHRAVARLARTGRLAAVVTTNFDTLIERALGEEGLVVDRYDCTYDYRRNPGDGFPVFKVHGSATGGDFRIDTVAQKLRGLPPYVRAKLTPIFSKHPVVVLGYSGGDLEFGIDYLALRCVPKGVDRIRWVFRPEERNGVDARTIDLLNGRGRLCFLDLSRALEALGAGAVHLEWNGAARAATCERLRTHARDMYARIGNLNTLAFCMRLLSLAGKMHEATDVWHLLAERIGRRRKDVSNLAPAMRALAVEGHRLVGALASRPWACRILRNVHDRRQFRPVRNGFDDAYCRDAREEGLACLAIGDSMVRLGHEEQAGIAMECAMACSEFLGDPAMLPAVYRLYGWRERTRLEQLHRKRPVATIQDMFLKDMIRHEGTSLYYLNAAEAASLVTGSVDPMDCAWIRAEMLIARGEYDAALLCIERLEERMGLGLHRETMVRIAVSRGEVELRQGYAERAVKRWNDSLAGPALGNPYLEAYVRHAIIGRMGFAPEWRALVLSLCDQILGAMDAGKLPSDAPSDLLAPRAYFETVKLNLSRWGNTPLDPGFMERLDFDKTREEFERWPLHYLRQYLVEAEFQRDTREVLRLLDQMVSAHFLEGSADRALEAANAHFRRARLDGDDREQLSALANQAAVRSWLGDKEEAEALYAQALSHPRARGRARSGLHRRLPHGLWASKLKAIPVARARDPALDVDDALALKWNRPATGEEREGAARSLFAANNFVIGRVLAFEAIAAYREDGNFRGANRAWDLLESAARQERRSGYAAIKLCQEPIIFRQPAH